MSGILFVITMMTCFLLFIAFIKNHQTNGEPIPHWYLIVHSVEILLYVLYFAMRRRIRLSRECSAILLFLLHDLFLIALMLLIASMTYLYISLTLFYYVIFFGIIIKKRTERREDEPQRCELPRKTFIEMTELFNNNY